jgi:hypothetical protein
LYRKRISWRSLQKYDLISILVEDELQFHLFSIWTIAPLASQFWLPLQLPPCKVQNYSKVSNCRLLSINWSNLLAVTCLLFNVIPLETHPFHDEAAHPWCHLFLLLAASKAVTAVKKFRKLGTAKQLDVGDGDACPKFKYLISDESQ